MAIDLSTPRSRRSLMTGGLAALGALVLGGIARPAAVSAHDPDDIQLGGATIQDETNGTWIRNQTPNGAGLTVQASDNGYGLSASSSGSGLGVQGWSAKGIGVNGVSNAGGSSGVLGQSKGGTGVLGVSGGGPAPASHAKTGVFGVANQDAVAVGVLGQSTTGRGGVFKGKLAQLRLPPSSAASHPHAGQPGDVFVDSSYRLWFCKGGAAWTQLA